MEENKNQKNISKAQKKDDKKQDIESALLDIATMLTKPGNCSCGEAFSYTGLGTYICKRCRSSFKNEYAKVRDFVDEFGTNYNIYEISKKTGVPKWLIDLFIKDGRFDTVKKQKRCRECKCPIEKGLYCNRCALRQINDEMQNDSRRHMTGSIRTNENMKGEMHYINKSNPED